MAGASPPYPNSISLTPQQDALHAAAVAASQSITFVTAPTNGLNASVNGNGQVLYFLTPAQTDFAQAAIAASATLSVAPASGQIISQLVAT